MKRLLALLCTLILAFSVLPAAMAEGEGEAEAEASLRLSETELTLAVGKKGKLTPALEGAGKKPKVSYVWESSDESVAKVKDGSVKAIAPGEAEITCTATLSEDETLTASAKVTVVIPITSVKAEEAKMSLAYGQTERIAYQVKPDDATEKRLSWKSDNEAVATVDQEGNVTGGVPGKATIIGVTRDGSNKEIKIKVTVKEEALSPGLQIFITSAKIKQKKDGLSIKITYTNRTGKALKNIGLVQCFDRQDGKGIFYHNAETGRVELNWRTVNFEPPVKDGKEGTMDAVIPSLKEPYVVARLRFAVYRYTLEDGTVVTIPDSQLYWYSSATDAYEPRTLITQPYQAPSLELQKQAENNELGFSTQDFYSPLAEGCLGCPEAGKLVVSVKMDSVAENAGIRIGDLIYGADELRFVNEPFFMTYAKDRLLREQEVIFHLFRNGAMRDLTLWPDGSSETSEILAVVTDGKTVPKAQPGSEGEDEEEDSGEIPEGGETPDEGEAETEDGEISDGGEIPNGGDEETAETEGGETSDGEDAETAETEGGSEDPKDGEESEDDEGIWLNEPVG